MTFSPQTTADFAPKRRRLRHTRYTASRSQGKYVPSPADFISSYYAVRNRWMSETALYSDPDDVMGHPSFRALVENAKVALPLILSDLRAGPSNLVFVLEEAFKTTPYSRDSEGDLRAMTDAWLAWGEKNAWARW